MKIENEEVLINRGVKQLGIGQNGIRIDDPANKITGFYSWGWLFDAIKTEKARKP